MSFVPARELCNHTTEVLDCGDKVVITVNGAPRPALVAIRPPKKTFLTIEDLKAMRPGRPVAEPHPHDIWNDSTDDLGPIQ